jgi:hypothetical protein
VAEVCEATASVVTVKEPLAPVAETVALAGTVAADVLELDKATTAPPGGPLPVRTTVPLEVLPPTSAGGVRDTMERADGVTVSAAVFVAPPQTAV